MKLSYYKIKNFGDALNPLIFENLLPNFFDEDPKELFLGIGSILGLLKPSASTEKVIVFSSGFAGGDSASSYGTLPTKEELKKYDFRCVRGPLTAQALNISKKKAICDAAILLPEVYTIKKVEKKYKFSYMPHIGSLDYFPGWKDLMESVGIRFIDPNQDLEVVIEEISSSEILLTEAMHGAIVADTLRVPWIPLKTRRYINEFKWHDFCLSLDLNYQPYHLKTLYGLDFMKGIVKNKTGGKITQLDNMIAKSYLSYQDAFVEKRVKKAINEIKNQKPFLSNYDLLNSKKDQLLNSLQELSKEYAS